MDTPEKPATPLVAVPAKPAQPVPAKQGPGIQTKTIPVGNKEKPAGWFSFSKKGMRAAMLNLVNASNLPDYWKTAIAGDIQSLDVKYNYVAIDCHRHAHGGKGSVHYTFNADTIAG